MHQANNVMAEALAGADEEVQAGVLNEFVSTLTVMCKHHPHSAGIGMQGHYIARNLRRETAEFFREMVASYDCLQDHTTKELDEARQELERVRNLVKLERERLDSGSF